MGVFRIAWGIAIVLEARWFWMHNVDRARAEAPVRGTAAFRNYFDESPGPGEKFWTHGEKE